MASAARKVTLAEIARQAGVSLATASRVLNGSARTVGPELHERVERVATQLNYSPSGPAQAVARGRTNVVGLVVPDIADPYFSTIAASIMRTAEPHDMMITLASTQRRPEREAEYVASLRHQRARGVILVGSRTTGGEHEAALTAEMEAFAAGGGRISVISQQQLPADTVVIENRAGARALGNHLAALGYRRFAVLAGPADLVTARDRLAGFRAGLRRAGVSLAPENIVHSGFDRDGGYESALALLDRGADVQCVFAVNDIMAVGAMAAFRDRGLRLPHDMAVAGFDDIVSLRDITPALTTVRIPLETLGEAALDLVLDESPEQLRVRRFRGEVVIRASTPAV